jgi:L-2,4-diaminobutyric acid acetyltransferase
MWRLADGAVDRNSPYSYLMLCEYFRDTCAVATVDERLVAFATGFRLPDDADTLFVWQIATDPFERSRGVATALLDHVVDAPTVPRTRFVEATVTPENAASLRLFGSFASRRGAECCETPLFHASDFPTPHAPELKLRIGPF